MKKTIVVLGMHSSGTSMISGILHAAGINMNPNPSGKVRHYKTNEDADFFRLNVRILASLRGGWLDPPTESQITGTQFEREIKRLITDRNKNPLWGFKNPRTCITAPLYHNHLRNPHYILVFRSHEDIAESIMRRGGKEDAQQWIALSKEYYRQAEAFLGSVDVPVLRVHSENLFVKGLSAEGEIRRLVKFVGLIDTETAVATAMNTILNRGAT